jgi:hypothetical protein
VFARVLAVAVVTKGELPFSNNIKQIINRAKPTFVSRIIASILYWYVFEFLILALVTPRVELKRIENRPRTGFEDDYSLFR